MKEIEKIIEHYEKAILNNEKLALGTVVKVEGSAYRRIGARLLVSETGQWTGGISGGCLEGDALKRAKIAILKAKSSIVVYDTLEDDEHQIGVGLGCNGRIEVLFTPINHKDKHNQVEFLKQITNRRQATILLQILSSNNSDSNLCGDIFTLDTLDDLAQKTLVDKHTIQAGIDSVFHKRKSNIFTLTNSQQETFEVLFEHIRPKIKLICIGDNYDVNAMINVGNELGWYIHLVGKTRKVGKTLLNKVDSFTDFAKANDIKTDEYTAVVLMSHDYKTDLRLLHNFLKVDLPYLGLLGPKKRLWKMNDALNDDGLQVNLDDFEHLYSPVGLDIGAETPEEIALAIAAEITAVFRGRDGGFLKIRQGSKH